MIELILEILTIHTGSPCNENFRIIIDIIHQSRPEIDKKPNLLNSHLAAYHICLMAIV